jgi:hypothetical protein
MMQASSSASRCQTASFGVASSYGPVGSCDDAEKLGQPLPDTPLQLATVAEVPARDDE